jgi:hypothetical protein
MFEGVGICAYFQAVQVIRLRPVGRWLRFAVRTWSRTEMQDEGAFVAEMKSQGVVAAVLK